MAGRRRSDRALRGSLTVAGAASCGAAGASAAVLGVDCRGSIERGRGDGGWGVAAGRDPLVPGGGWDGTFASVAARRSRSRGGIWRLPSGRRSRCGGRRTWRAGDRTALGAGGIDDLAGTAAQRGDAERQPGLSGDHGAVACGAGGASSEGGEARDECGAAGLCAGSAGRCRRHTGRCCGARAGGALEGTAARAAAVTDAGRWRGARSRLLSVCGSTTRMTRRCASATRRSTRRFTSKAGAR